MSSSAQIKTTETAIELAVKSCRIPVSFAFLCGLLWLVTASALGFLALLKFHAPSLLADCPWFTYGRLIAASKATLLFGFVLNGSIGTLLYIVPSASRSTLCQPGLTTIAILFINIATKLGILSIFLGNGNSFQWLAIPKFSISLIIFAYLIIAVIVTLSFHNRDERAANPALTAGLIALLWIPWALSVYALVFDPENLRGVMYAVVGWWVANQLVFIVPSLIVLTIVFKYIPVFLGGELKEVSMGRLGLWTLLFFGSMAGVGHGAPVAMGIPSISAAATLVTIVAVIALAYMLHGNFYASYGAAVSDTRFRFIAVAVEALLLVWILKALTAWYPVAQIAGLTTVNESLGYLLVIGSFMMAFFGLIYYATPRLLTEAGNSTSGQNGAFWCGLVGALLLLIALGVGGLVQGKAMTGTGTATPDAIGSIIPFLRLAVTGHLLVLIASSWVSYYFISAIAKSLCCCCKSSGSCSSKTAEVAA